ncbi:MAG: hypothetical protein A2038_09365 [Deltaproteobacteria bacterium GWA2_57_13]|nr:MAG: hypothetical protein A2038_09365 [Deltaproteobacteria bacterium GWA2_57_13]
MQRTFKIGDRVRVISTHPWMPDRSGTMKRVEYRIGNRFLVKFDRDELGLWHDEEGDPVLRLGEKALVLIRESLSLAA